MLFEVDYIDNDGNFNHSLVEASKMSDAIAFVEKKPNCCGVDTCKIRYNKYYMNCSTGEISPLQAVARKWYREGISVEMYKDGRMALRMNALLVG